LKLLSLASDFHFVLAGDRFMVVTVFVSFVPVLVGSFLFRFLSSPLRVRFRSAVLSPSDFVLLYWRRRFCFRGGSPVLASSMVVVVLLF
jgi:hypothetical protein